MSTKQITGLSELYSKHWQALREELLNSGTDLTKLSKPWLVDLVPGYEASSVKVLIVGKEANGWGRYADLLEIDRDEAIESLQQKYRSFRQEQKMAHTPFWKGAASIHRALNPDCTDSSFITTNLIKMDQDKKPSRNRRPVAQMEELICKHFSVLKEEIALLKPDVVVFFTGPHYDKRIQQTFNEIEFDRVEEFKKRHVSRLVHEDLPLHTYRTYHPGFSMRNSERYFLPVVEALQRLVLKKP
ncbi:hypothetical protein ACFQPF_05355 [Fictibacillus iocasae]|uniref:Uracil-DNA glycosylase-like domain-containing protein n=1 Tax=Fictibacillus iocasae TaxID=2715437 RepID=A0ABW2NNL7_9BACL